MARSRQVTQRPMRKGGLSYVNNGGFPSALREVRDDLTRRPVIVGMLALGVILGISGPFDTWRVMPALPRLMYWIIVVIATFATGNLVSVLISSRLKQTPIWLYLTLSSCAIGLAVTMILGLLNYIAFGIAPSTIPELFTLIATVTVISAVVRIGSHFLRTETPPQVDQSIPLLARLPAGKRGALIGLSAEDHYVRVTTTKGEELVLLRFSDAISEIGPTVGLQIHRSHWVALDQIKDVTKQGDRGNVTTTDGITRPISRGFMPAVRKAGLLPKTGST